jgi:hypothetical protein
MQVWKNKISRLRHFLRGWVIRLDIIPHVYANKIMLIKFRRVRKLNLEE